MLAAFQTALKAMQDQALFAFLKCKNDKKL
jgi:hypothetical protein